ncbi:MAG: ribonuclease P protein component [Candidatus Levyibacteriota bacterium]
MFKRSQRFSFRRGTPKLKRITPLFILRFQKSEETPKYAVVTGKIVSKKAVLRNRVKRIFLQSLKEVIAETPNSYDLVFFLRRPSHEYQKSSIIGEIKDVIAGINRI